jgi:hypothetical protein
MQKRYAYLFLIVFNLLVLNTAHAQLIDQLNFSFKHLSSPPNAFKRHSFNIGFGSTLLPFAANNYSYLYNDAQAVYLELGYDRKGFNSSSLIGKVSLGIRSYFSKNQDSFFWGGHVMYAQGTIQEEELIGQGIGKNKQMGVIANLGKRWVLSTGFNFTIRIGGGYLFYKRDDLDPNGVSLSDKFVVDGELSIGISL